ncbi:MAG: hypothetical protein AB7P49_18715 [Bdellovibrionales bacterium]
MSNSFERYREAQTYALTVTNISARTALHVVHHLFLEGAGLPLHFLPEQYRPTKTLDVLYFYKTIERLFTEWTGEIKKYPENPDNRERMLQLQEAKELIPTLPTEQARVGLMNYLSILRNVPIPKGTFVDVLFCSRILSVLLSQPELLDHILSGDNSWETIDPWEGILD